MDTDDKATPADVTRADIDALLTELREFGQAVTVGWLSADRYARAAAALAAERDRADRAEAALDETNALIEGVVQALEEEPEACDAGSIIAALNIRLRFDAIRKSEATA